MRLMRGRAVRSWDNGGVAGGSPFARSMHGRNGIGGGKGGEERGEIGRWMEPRRGGESQSCVFTMVIDGSTEDTGESRVEIKRLGNRCQEEQDVFCPVVPCSHPERWFPCVQGRERHVGKEGGHQVWELTGRRLHEIGGRQEGIKLIQKKANDGHQAGVGTIPSQINDVGGSSSDHVLCIVLSPSGTFLGWQCIEEDGQHVDPSEKGSCVERRGGEHPPLFGVCAMVQQQLDALFPPFGIDSKRDGVVECQLGVGSHSYSSVAEKNIQHIGMASGGSLSQGRQADGIGFKSLFKSRVDLWMG